MNASKRAASFCLCAMILPRPQDREWPVYFRPRFGARQVAAEVEDGEAGADGEQIPAPVAPHGSQANTSRAPCPSTPNSPLGSPDPDMAGTEGGAGTRRCVGWSGRTSSSGDALALIDPRDLAPSPHAHRGTLGKTKAATPAPTSTSSPNRTGTASAPPTTPPSTGDLPRSKAQRIQTTYCATKPTSGPPCVIRTATAPSPATEPAFGNGTNDATEDHDKHYQA
jgi:hypothetical protein